MYWLLFEAVDLFRLRRSTASWTIDSFILPINALSFLGLSFVKWQSSEPEHLYAFLAAGAALYLASALLRTRLRPPSTFDPDSGTLDRIAGGSYEGPITLSAGLAAAAILVRANGQWINLDLLIEGEILFLAGISFRTEISAAVGRGRIFRIGDQDRAGGCIQPSPSLSPDVPGPVGRPLRHCPRRFSISTACCA